MRHNTLVIMEAGVQESWEHRIFKPNLSLMTLLQTQTPQFPFSKTPPHTDPNQDSVTPRMMNGLKHSRILATPTPSLRFPRCNKQHEVFKQFLTSQVPPSPQLSQIPGSFMSHASLKTDYTEAEQWRARHIGLVTKRTIHASQRSSAQNILAQQSAWVPEAR